MRLSIAQCQPIRHDRAGDPRVAPFDADPEFGPQVSVGGLPEVIEVALEDGFSGLVRDLVVRQHEGDGGAAEAFLDKYEVETYAMTGRARKARRNSRRHPIGTHGRERPGLERAGAGWGASGWLAVGL